MSPILPLDTQRRRSKRGENLSNRQSGSATPSSAAPKEFVERSIFLPRRLNMRLDELCDRSGKEPSELIIDAIRLLMSGGVPTAAASIGGTSIAALADASPFQSPTDMLNAEPATLGYLREKFADTTMSNAELREGLAQIMSEVEVKDHFITQHANSVAALARKTARHFELDDDELLAVDLAGLVHDIGKLRLPDEILGKRGKLTPDEWKLVKQYPEFGAEILSDYSHLEPVVELVIAHQERWDGSGYPRGLAGDDIPLGAQIVAICDVYNVLTSERSYRPALPDDIARRTIEGGVGRLWNPELATVFLNKILPKPVSRFEAAEAQAAAEAA